MSNKNKFQTGKDVPLKKEDRGKKPVKKKVRKKSSREIKSFEEFIVFSYSRNGQKIGLNKKAIEAISKATKLDEEAYGRLLELIRKDKILAVPRQLLLVSMEIDGFPMIKDEIRKFVNFVLSENAVFSMSGVADLLQNKSDVPDVKTPLVRLARLDYSKIKELPDYESIKPRDFEKLKINFVYTLAVWFSEIRHLDLDKISEYLFESLWSSAATSLKDETLRLRALTEISDLAGAGIACQVYASQTSHFKRIADETRRAKETLEGENLSLHEENEEIRKQLDYSAQKIKELSEALKTEQQKHAYTSLYLKDDMEQLRSRLLRRMKAEVELLEEGLYALRKDKPKIHIMEDHAERALDGLKKEIKELEDE